MNTTRGNADHNVISVVYRLNKDISSKMETRGRDRSNFSEEEFKRQVTLLNWEEIFNEQNVDIATYKFEMKILEILNKQAPMKKYQPRARNSKWISPNTKRIMNDRDQQRNKAVGSNLQEDWDNYKILRNLCNKNVKTDRNENLKKQYNKLHEENDTKGLYELTKKKWDGVNQDLQKCL